MTPPAGSILITIGEIFGLLVFVGGVIVGGIGALLSRARGGTALGGFLRSILLPIWPLGWLWVLWSTRDSAGRAGEERALDSSYLSPTEPDSPVALSPAPEPRSPGSGGRRF